MEITKYFAVILIVGALTLLTEYVYSNRIIINPICDLYMTSFPHMFGVSDNLPLEASK